jgi:hypothetical protein
VSEKQNRSWQEISADAYKGQDPMRRQLLSEELERCLEERVRKIASQNPPESKKHSA